MDDAQLMTVLKAFEYLQNIDFDVFESEEGKEGVVMLSLDVLKNQRGRFGRWVNHVVVQTHNMRVSLNCLQNLYFSLYLCAFN